MNVFKNYYLVVLLTLFHSYAFATNPPRVFLLNGKKMLEVRTDYLKGNQTFAKSIKTILKAGDKALNFAPVSVMDKTQTPVSGDKHDYVSLAKYWFPNPNTPNGLPYIRKDGVVNPEVKLYKDYENLNKMTVAIQDAAIAYYFSLDEKYAAHATKLVKTWFLDAETRMNPNLNYAQAVMGSNDGRSWGVLEGQDFRKIIDAIGLLEGSSSWKNEFMKGFKSWMNSYFKWLTESENGIEESIAPNNHGTWYQVQAVSIALFLEKNEYAKQLCEMAKEKRIAAQIKPDGTQPLELVRTKGLSYCEYNLRALMELALLAENVNVELWNYKTNDGRCIRLALDFLIPYVLNEKKWPYQQIEPFKSEGFASLLYIASIKYKDDSYLKFINKISSKDISASSIIALY